MTPIDWIVAAIMAITAGMALVVFVHCGRRYAAASAAVMLGSGCLAAVTIISGLTSPEMQVTHGRFFELLSWLGVCALLARLGWRREQ